MEKESIPMSSPSLYSHEGSIQEDEIAKKVKDLELSLPSVGGVYTPNHYYYQNFWCPDWVLSSLISIQNHFQSQDTDIILASKPKSGMTWLKALVFTILNRKMYPTNNQDPSKPHPLLTYNPHELVPFLEITTFSTAHLPDDPEHRRPRILSTHLPYKTLPESIKKSGCRIVYISRNILDVVVSLWIFASGSKEVRKDGVEVSTTLEDYLNSFCKGEEGYGPHWDHVLGYWQESLQSPNKVLFMKYEDIKGNEKSEIKRLAEFIGSPFSLEEEESGVIEEISKLCSFGNLRELEVNKSGQAEPRVTNSMFFRKGEIGDWVNHMSPCMAERLEKIMQEKLQGSGLTFNTSNTP